jgi:hypothetical protein
VVFADEQQHAAQARQAAHSGTKSVRTSLKTLSHS